MSGIKVNPVQSNPIASFQIVDQSFGVEAPVVLAQNVNANVAANFQATTRVDAGWAHAAATNAFTYTGTPDHVDISVMVRQGGAVARAAPSLQLLRNGVQIAESNTGYIRNATGHAESSNTISFIDYTPGANPVYTILARQESTAAGATNTLGGSFQAKAVEKISVVETVA